MQRMGMPPAEVLQRVDRYWHNNDIHDRAQWLLAVGQAMFPRRRWVVLLHRMGIGDAPPCENCKETAAESAPGISGVSTEATPQKRTSPRSALADGAGAPREL